LLFGRFPNAQRAVVSFAISLKTAIRVWDVSVRKTRTARMALVAALAASRRPRWGLARVIDGGSLDAVNPPHSCSETLENCSDAQRAPSARPGFSMPFRECAQSPWVLIVKSGDFPVKFHEDDGLKNRRMERKKSCNRTSGAFTYT
jgi:hypothetical protein